jgi:hypothetical protein
MKIPFHKAQNSGAGALSAMEKAFTIAVLRMDTGRHSGEEGEKINYERREKGRGDGRRFSCRCARWARQIGKT